MHHPSKGGKLLFRTPVLQLFLSQEVFHPDQVFDGFLFQSGLEFGGLPIFGPNRFGFDVRVCEEGAEFKPFE